MLSFGYSYFSQGIFVGKSRYAETTENDIFDDNTTNIVYLEQNWDRQDSLWFYNTTQGSNWLPYDIFLYLEQADSEKLFRDNENMNRYRYLTQAPSFGNPDGLPIGFVKDTYQDKEYIGFTCAACHTAQLDYKGTGIRIDGGPALADMERMLLELELALKSSLDNADKFVRLSQRILGKKYSNEKARADFRKKLKAVYERQAFYNFSNAPKHGDDAVHYGYGRLDAFGRIFNRILSHIAPDDKTNFNPANAPVSYPFLWDTPHSDFVQWNGIGNNHKDDPFGFLGPLGRNVGEVLGVFATFSITADEKGELQLDYSADKHNLIRLEQLVKQLQSPQWPEHILPPLDRQLAEKGKQVYQEYRCGWCHDGGERIIQPTDQFKRNDPNRLMITQHATLPWIQTDPQMAQNALSYQGNMGILTGQPLSEKSTETFAQRELVLPALSTVVQEVIGTPTKDKSFIRRRLEQAYIFITSFLDNVVPTTQRRNDFEVVNNGISDLNSYRGRTLNGIWTTAPYLHNGSVRNLYELFLPSCSDAEIATGKECRANRFTVGSRQFDPVKVGFVNKNKRDYPDITVFDTSKPGNHNYGHEYAAGKTPIIDLDENGKPKRDANGQLQSFVLPPMPEDQRWALVEYLKTL